MATGAGIVGVSVVSAPAGATPVNLIQNGDFEQNPGTTSYLTVFADDSTTITGWTVVTPSTYPGGGGSVDVVSANYWNPDHGSYSIDLGGTSSAAGGLYQNVPTVPGVAYSLSFASAVNGDQAPGVSHTMGVTVNGTAVNVNGTGTNTVTAVGTGHTLTWVQNVATFTATSASSKIEFDDTTPGDTNQGPALDNVSLTAAPDVITATPVTIAPQTTGVPFSNTTVATFTDSYPSPPPSIFAATITWGDGHSSAGTITQNGSAFTVSGGNTYAAHGTYPVVVSISSNTGGGGSATVNDTANVADTVTTCTGSGCSGSVSTSSQNVGISSTSTSGTILTTIDPASSAFSCGDSFRHAPEVVTVTDTGLNANIVYTVTFANKSAAGSWLVPFAVCYQAQTPFTDLYGHSVTTGLLPLCTLIPRPNKPLVAPCVQSITELPLYIGNVVEKIVVPPGDPKFH